MPTVLRQDGYEIRIYINDHVPSHVHIVKADVAAIINLGDENTAPEIDENFRMKKGDLKKALRIVEDNQEFLLEQWRQIHG
jgi:Domain of unknown function (DUF4160)